MGKEVWKDIDLVPGSQSLDVQDADPVGPAKIRKVLQTEKAQVRCVVPLVGKFLGDRDPAAEKNLDAREDLAEVRGPDDDLLADPQGLEDDVLRVQDLLQTFVEDHVIETLVGIILQPRIDVPVRNGQPL